MTGGTVVPGGDCDGVVPGAPADGVDPPCADAVEPFAVDVDAPGADVVVRRGPVVTALVVEPDPVVVEYDDGAVPSSAAWVGLSPHAVASIAIATMPAAMVVPACPIGGRP
jgi:hypothetical protein